MFAFPAYSVIGNAINILKLILLTKIENRIAVLFLRFACLASTEFYSRFRDFRILIKSGFCTKGSGISISFLEDNPTR